MTGREKDDPKLKYLPMPAAAHADLTRAAAACEGFAGFRLVATTPRGGTMTVGFKPRKIVRAVRKRPMKEPRG